MNNLRSQIDETVAAIREHSALTPKAGIILGSGLGALADKIEVEASISYEDLPHFPVSTVESHHGKLLLGRLNGTLVVAMQGRFQYYEGHTMQQITFPVRVMSALGASILVISNACGGLNPQFESGDVMVITDHINLLGDNPLIGPNDDTLGVRFPDMSAPYTPRLSDLAVSVALEKKVPVQKGVYVAFAGPNLETAAEYRFLRAIGADVVGMSTVPEVIVAVHGGMEVLGLSVVTDMGLPDALEAVDFERIIATANRAEPKLTTIMCEVIRQL
jgi:purine-nucleoside phosphorylase